MTIKKEFTVETKSIAPLIDAYRAEMRSLKSWRLGGSQADHAHWRRMREVMRDKSEDFAIRIMREIGVEQVTREAKEL